MHLLEIKNLVKSYGGRRVVDGVDLAIRRGEIVGLLGPNGAGKTTTFNMITGLIKADYGEISGRSVSANYNTSEVVLSREPVILTVTW